MDALGMVNALIGVVTVYFVLSLVVTAVVEWWQQFFGIRGRVLEESVKSLYDEQTVVPEFWLRLARPHEPSPRTNAFFKHARIWSLAEHSGRKPSYIDERTMAEVFVEVGLRDGGNQGPRLVDLMAAPASMRAALVALKSAQAGKPKGKSYASVLLDLFDAANGDTEAFMRGVQAWIHQVGQRATGWLRRRIMPVTLLISIAVAVITNADTVRVFQILTRNPEVAEKVAARAETIIASKAPCAKVVAGGATEAEKAECATLTYAKEQAIDVAPLLGWQGDRLALTLSTTTDTGAWWDPVFATVEVVRREPGAAFGKLVGLLLTTAALMLGAPFWFDVLQKLVKVRSSLRPDGNGKTDGDSSAPDAPAADGGPSPSAPAGGAASPGAVTDPDALAFNPVAVKVDLANALWLSRVSEAVYQPNDTGLLTKLSGAFDVVHAELDTTHGNTQFAILARSDVVILAFRGTEKTVADWMGNLKSRPFAPKWTQVGKVHTGFHDALEVVSPNDTTVLWQRLMAALRPALASGRPLWITGHSLGGALAALAAHRLAAEEKIRVAGLCTLGQPRCGDEAFCKELGGLLIGRYWRVVNHRDPVPRVPTTLQGDYDHAGTLLYADEFGRLLIDPAWWLRRLDMLALPEDKAAAAAIAKAAVEDHSEYTEILRRAVASTAGR